MRLLLPETVLGQCNASWSPEDRFSHSCTMTEIHGILWASLVMAETRQTLGYICMYYLSENI